MPVVRNQVEAVAAGAAMEAEIEADCAESSLFTRIPSGFQFLVVFLGRVAGRIKGLAGARRRLAAELRALEPDVARHARDCKQQHSERNEKTHH
jgi:hypothetical protein